VLILSDASLLIYWVLVQNHSIEQRCRWFENKKLSMGPLRMQQPINRELINQFFEKSNKQASIVLFIMSSGHYI